MNLGHAGVLGTHARRSVSLLVRSPEYGAKHSSKATYWAYFIDHKHSLTGLLQGAFFRCRNRRRCQHTGLHYMTGVGPRRRLPQPRVYGINGNECVFRNKSNKSFCLASALHLNLAGFFAIDSAAVSVGVRSRALADIWTGHVPFRVKPTSAELYLKCPAERY